MVGYIWDDNVKGIVVEGLVSDDVVFGKRVVVRGKRGARTTTRDRYIRLEMARECGVVVMSVMAVAFFSWA